MSRLFIIACCIGSISANPVQGVLRARHPRIVLGETIDIEEAPYQVSVIKLLNATNGVHMCGGTILSKNLVLTAGHCAVLKPEEYRIRSGSSNWTEGGQLHKVVKVIQHEDYKVDLFNRASHDIAILKVSPKFKLDGKTKKVTKLANKNDKVTPGQTAYVTGWGKTEKNIESEVLKGLALKIMNFKKCSKDYEYLGNMTEYDICAEHPSGKRDICNGDSGGPLVVEGKQVGIVSWSWSGPGCAHAGRPGVYTDVAKYRDWIDQHVKAIR